MSNLTLEELIKKVQNDPSDKALRALLEEMKKDKQNDKRM